MNKYKIYLEPILRFVASLLRLSPYSAFKVCAGYFLLSFSEVLLLGSLYLISSNRFRVGHETAYATNNVLNIFSSFDNSAYLLSIFSLLIALLATFLRLYAFRVALNSTRTISNEAANHVFHTIISQSYPTYLLKPTSFYTSLLLTDVNRIEKGLIEPLSTSLGAILSVLGISFFIIKTSGAWAIFACILLLLLLFALTFKLRFSILQSSKNVVLRTHDLTHFVQESLSDIKSVILANSSSSLSLEYKNIDNSIRISQNSLAFTTYLPKASVDFFIVALISLSVLASSRSNNNSTGHEIPILLFYSVYRLIPYGQKIYENIVQIARLQPSLVLINCYLSPLFSLKATTSSLPNSNGSRHPQSLGNPRAITNIHEKDIINLEGISYRYHTDSPIILDKLHLSLSSGDRLCISGQSGSGKSTLADIAMGLLRPTYGNVLFNSTKIWSSEENLLGYRSIISYLPQHVFIRNTNALQNITGFSTYSSLSSEQISLLFNVLQICELSKLLDIEHLDTALVGERGSRLSVGQCQRLGLARALFSRPRLLVLDEFTSALDSPTAHTILHNLLNSSLLENTIIMAISHDEYVISKFDRSLSLPSSLD